MGNSAVGNFVSTPLNNQTLSDQEGKVIKEVKEFKEKHKIWITGMLGAMDRTTGCWRI